MSEVSFNPQFQLNNIDGKIIAALERISESFRVLLWNESKKHGVSPIQVQVLIFLNFHSDEKRKISYLAKEFNMTKATVSEAVKSLEKKELIEKEYEPNDTRSYIINLTQKGEKIARQTAQFTQTLEQSVALLGSGDKNNLLQNLLSVIQSLNKADVITVQRMCFNCSYYEKSTDGHFCKLLNQPLHVSELRIDCPEHAMAV